MDDIAEVIIIYSRVLPKIDIYKDEIAMYL